MPPIRGIQAGLSLPLLFLAAQEVDRKPDARQRSAQFVRDRLEHLALRS